MMRRAVLSIVLATAMAVAHAQAPPSVLGGAFELIDHNGQPFSSTKLADTPYAIFFGYLHCPDVCPTTLLGLSNVLAGLGTDAGRLEVLFVTLDPERDRPQELRAYLSSFDAHIIGLTGATEAVDATAKLWNVSHYKLPEDDASYTIVHSAYVYLMDRRHHCVGTLGFQDSEAEQLAKLRSLLN
jgi:protein SCO1/2